MHKPPNEIRPEKGKGRQIFLTVTEPTELMILLMSKMPDKGRKTIKSLLAHNQVSVDNKITSQFNHHLKPGQQVGINFSKVIQVSKDKGLKIIFEDPFIIVIDKEHGLLSIATDKEKERTAFRIVSDQLKITDPTARIFVVHRLDRDASGILMFAKSREIQQILQNAWKKDVIERSYVVVVEGRVILDQGTITSWLKENKARVMYSSATPDVGQKAVTHYQVLKRSNEYSLLQVRLETGRKNQIRVHMKDLGHSIIGDKKYGATQNPINRLGLHARVLVFRHPVTGKEMRFETPIPQRFYSCTAMNKDKEILTNNPQ
jgi:23S rRNA pseudouridine1911/1915/1917 synthase